MSLASRAQRLDFLTSPVLRRRGARPCVPVCRHGRVPFRPWRAASATGRCSFQCRLSGKKVHWRQGSDAHREPSAGGGSPAPSAGILARARVLLPGLCQAGVQQRLILTVRLAPRMRPRGATRCGGEPEPGAPPGNGRSRPATPRIRTRLAAQPRAQAKTQLSGSGPDLTPHLVVETVETRLWNRSRAD